MGIDERATESWVARDPAGRPTGIIDEPGIRGLAARIPALSDAEVEASTQPMIHDLNGAGLTAFGSAGCEPDVLALYERWAAQARLNVRVFCITSAGGAGNPEQVDRLLAQIGRMKFFQGDNYVDHVTYGHRRERHLPDSGARGRLPDHGGAGWIHHRHPGGHPGAGGTNGEHQPADGALWLGRDRDCHGRSAADQHQLVDPWRQYRPEAGAGAAGPGTKLDVAGHARAGEPDDLAGREHADWQPRRGGRCAPIPVQSRRAAGHIRDGVRQSASVQPGCGRGVSVHLQPVRCHDGPLRGRASDRRYPFGHQYLLRVGEGELSRHPLQRGASRAQSCCAHKQSAAGFHTGGPVLRDRLHFFSHFDYEREPRTSIWNTPYPSFNVELRGNETVKMGGGRLDYQISPDMRLMGKVTAAERWQPFGAGGTQHPAATGTTAETNREYLVSLTQVLSNRAVNEIRVGKTRWIFRNRNLTTWSNH